MSGWTQKALDGTFPRGLKAEIVNGVRMFKPRTLRDAIELARLRDDTLLRDWSIGRAEGQKFTHPHKPLSKYTYPSDNPAPTARTPATRTYSSGTAKKLSWEEMQKRREKGLCFGCNEKFTPGHRCQKPQAFWIKSFVPTDEPEEVEVFVAESVGEQMWGTEDEPLISLHALAGYNGPKTMRLMCTIGKRQLVILIDSGSTHNFVDQKIVEALQLAVIPVDKFWVKVANGEKLCYNERYENVPIMIQGSYFVTTLYALPLHGLDVVLGVQWLGTLGASNLRLENDDHAFYMGESLGDPCCPTDQTCPRGKHADH